MATSITTIQSTDLITNSRADINNNFDSLLVNKIETDVITTDSTFADASDSKIPSQLAVKQYVDAGGNVNASITAKGIVELATSAEIDAGTATGGTGAALVVTADALKGSLAPIVRTYLNAGSPHTWTKPAGLKYVVVEVQAGGGGGESDGAGAGGGYSRKLIGTASLGTTETVTVGVAGSGSTTTATAGGNSSFGTHSTANGGGAGTTGTPSAGGSSASGDVNITGGAGNTYVNGDNSHNYGLPGGDSMLGHGGFGGEYQSVGGNGSGYGAGGGAGGDSSYSGGNGAPGIVIVTEYYV